MNFERGNHSVHTKEVESCPGGEAQWRTGVWDRGGRSCQGEEACL